MTSSALLSGEQAFDLRLELVDLGDPQPVGGDVRAVRVEADDAGEAGATATPTRPR